MPKSDGKNSDFRARLQLFKKHNDEFFKDVSTGNVMEPLKANRGIVFPYTPNIYFARAANYGQMEFKGSNYPIYSYVNSTPPVIPLIATFTASTSNIPKSLTGIFIASLRASQLIIYDKNALIGFIRVSRPKTIPFKVNISSNFLSLLVKCSTLPSI